MPSLKGNQLGTSRTLIYGAIAKGQAGQGIGLPHRVKRAAKIVRDTTAARLSGKLGADCKDYEVPFASNVGDEAIAEAVRNHLFGRMGDEFLNVNWGDLAGLTSDGGVNAPRKIVVAGSGYFLFSAAGKLPRRLWDDAQYFENTNAPLILYGVGVNHLHDPKAGQQPLNMSEDNRALLRRILARASLITVRDVFSQEVLQAYTDKPVMLSGDPALFLYKGSQRPMPPRRASDDRPRIGINFPFHGVLVESLLKQNLTAYVAFLKELQEKTNCTFYYCVHSESESLVPWLLRSHGIRLKVLKGDAYFLSEQYATLDVHIGGMLHSCILATGVGTPCVSLSYDTKHQGFFDLIGMPDFCHEASSFKPAAALQSVLQLLREREQWQACIQTHKAKLSEVFDDALEVCNSVT